MVPTAKHPKTIAKPGLRPEDVRLSIWWNSKGVLWFDLLHLSSSINVQLYCQQLVRLADQTQYKCLNHGPVRLLLGSFRLHVAYVTWQKLLELVWVVLIHLPYSSDLAVSD